MQRLNKNFLEKLALIYNKNELEIIKNAFLNTSRKSTFRLNTFKNDFDAIKELKKYNFQIEKIDYLTNWYKIIKNWDIRLSQTKSFQEWYIYVQWITSQIPVELSNHKNPKNILDLTSAPGWKATQIAQKYKNATIYANELNKIRLEKLKYTIKKQQATNIEILNYDARELKNKFENSFFDIIIADLPCSAEWRINLNKEKTYKYLEKAWINKRNYKLQQDIIKNSISLLKSWWEFIYSTCTLDPLENEWIVHYILSNFPEMQICNIDNFFFDTSLKNISKKAIKSYKKYIFKNETQKAIRILPSFETEWFFIAKFIKK